jgi:hypothetical protein
MQPAAFNDAVFDAMRRIGGEKFNADDIGIHMHPDNWYDLGEALGPPYHFREQQAREAAERTGREFILPPKRWPNGEIIGMIHGCKVYSDDQVPRHAVILRRGSAHLTIGAGPFPPATEPEGGWKMDRPLYMPAKP